MLYKDLSCSSNPVSVENRVAFVIDLSKLKDPNDVRVDDLETQRCSGSWALTFFCEDN